ncbi:hypothetical protein M0534_11420 [Methylonatrum kenyense]|uniref:tetratricopeptide repeat protein n=1 Tax=Methylonatrum kenyense TaxID=455253 RepID=UPI0020BD76A3|nr:hypothetical protein [Methylonatrum kenyense]MCK8516929.1 hypothetical protein [Methylonatrum kenyense]
MLALLTAGFGLGLLVSAGLPGIDRLLAPERSPPPESTPDSSWSAVQHALDQATYAEARGLLLPLAEAGQARAQRHLARLHRDGQGGVRSHAQAYYWFQRAAEQGDARAQQALAGLYAHGYGVDRDLARAAFWSTRARLQDDSR